MVLSLRKKLKLKRADVTPQSVAELIRHHLNEVADLFDSPKMTLVIRSSSMEGDLIFTNDAADEAIIAIKKFCTQNSSQRLVVLPQPVN
jgi:hypothetical protein